MDQRTTTTQIVPLHGDREMHSLAVVTPIVIVYCTIALIGIIGNVLVIHVITASRQMRAATINLFLLNLAVADLIIMLAGLPEIVHYVLNRGWLLGLVGCKMLRYSMTSALYASVFTLMAVCLERYVATVHPLKAHLWCSRVRCLIVIVGVWIGALLTGLPTLLHVRLFSPVPTEPPHCLRMFSMNKVEHHRYYTIFSLVEFSLFYIIPLFTQIVLYFRIARTLSTRHQSLLTLQRPTSRAVSLATLNVIGRTNNNQQPGPNNLLQIPSSNVTIKQSPILMSHTFNSNLIHSRRQVIKMLVSCVAVYFTCYSPMFVPLITCLLFGQPFMSKEFQVVVLTMAYANSAANPVLYSIFSRRFRAMFTRALNCAVCRRGTCCQRPHTDNVRVPTEERRFRPAHRLHSNCTRTEQHRYLASILRNGNSIQESNPLSMTEQSDNFAKFTARLDLD